MPSRPAAEVRRRKPPLERRSEIVAAAAEIALAEGLDTLTLRRVAQELGVFPGLVSHYFPSVDDLVAAAFAAAAEQELEQVFAAVDRAASPLAAMRTFLAEMVVEDRDRLSLLWLDAWHGGRGRPALYDEVERQMDAWQARLAAVIVAGVANGAFHSAYPSTTATRILAVVDGLSVQAAMRPTVDYSAVRDLVTTTAEYELGLRAGALRPRRRPRR